MNPRSETPDAELVMGRCGHCRVFVPGSDLVYARDGQMHCVSCPPPAARAPEEARRWRHGWPGTHESHFDETDYATSMNLVSRVHRSLRPPRGARLVACVVSAILLVSWVAAFASQA